MSGAKCLLDTNVVIGLPDAIIVATAQVHQLTLLTLDQRLDRLAGHLKGTQ